MSRIVCWFSCGVTSAVAAKIAVDERPDDDVRIVYCDTRSEHPDNHRFLRDIGEWVGKEVEILASDKYHDTWDVFDKTGWLVGPAGARCTTELKKVLRQQYQEPDDIQVFGFDAGEAKRVEKFRQNNIEVNLWAPLIDKGLSKKDCTDIVLSAGIEVPEIYRLGFRNANCLGCPKGGMGYWNHTRKVFPEVFDRMAKVERKLGVAICSTKENGKRVRIYLDELDPDRGNYKTEPALECGLLCTFEDDEE